MTNYNNICKEGRDDRMISILYGEAVPINVWDELSNVESSALDQLRNVANMPGIFHHVAAMPDVHTGYGATIGSVIASVGTVCPSAVGVDIGCGMTALETGMKADDINSTRLRDNIEASIPVGHLGRKNPVAHSVLGRFRDTHKMAQDRYDKVESQLGTLGGGNHFIEICTDAYGTVWVMLHSGSRGIGKILADIHINEAKGLMKQYHISLPDPNLAYLAEGTPEFQAYMRDLKWAQDYAFANRQMMMDDVMRCLFVEGWDGNSGLSVNCHHNYVEREHHYGCNVLVTRKGAVRARLGEFGIIPGSMGAKSYIVQGLGNPESFHSCSHGAGRKMSRTQAKATFTEADLVLQTEGVNCRKDAGVLDEAPGAYKDIDTVMENQKDLVRVVAILKQFICVKG